MEKRRVILLSGGLDSIGVVHKVLQEPGAFDRFDINVFHVEYTKSLMHLPSKYVVNEMHMHYPNWRVYTMVDHNGSIKEPLDAAVKAMLAFGSENYLDGYLNSEEPMELEILAGMEFDDDDTTNIEELNEALQMIRKAYIHTGVGIMPTKVVSPVADLTKRQIKSIIYNSPFWSCRAPQVKGQNEYHPCGECESCKALSANGVDHPTLNCEYGPILNRLR